MPRFAIAAVLTLLCPATGRAQTYESIGIRAQGLGGAFVAVSDDATTTWWNPAGLPAGGYFNAVIETDRVEDPASTRARAIALTVPSLGLSYYSVALSGMKVDVPIESATLSREDQGVLRQFGATVGQSVGPHLVFGSTLKLVHALGATHVDLDAGGMAALGHVHLALVVKNLKEPEFSDRNRRLLLHRQARVGASVRAGSLDRAEIVGAIDADLTTTPTAFGDERRLATGVEAWIDRRSIGLRAGIGMNTVGLSRRSRSVGASLGLRGGLSADAQLTRGADEARNGFGFALRVTF